MSLNDKLFVVATFVVAVVSLTELFSWMGFAT